MPAFHDTYEAHPLANSTNHTRPPLPYQSKSSWASVSYQTNRSLNRFTQVEPAGIPPVSEKLLRTAQQLVKGAARSRMLDVIAR
ncbi:uncharacterized protein LY79DRAFT_546794 [Colletotrichum navitas]|uniref:Uncharacterized protein n=1 Tax=Colletotrichum navitas TaxID=681940 RepID=A0AAD8Q6I3_9PEZI|nr:uncharacterized protein LY79DRAFT_546794 [Colletotrichum navitas]KAK1595574.1 hypothetical protein LY79DRAFT_546794 [Colletotrichum navitas]